MLFKYLGSVTATTALTAALSAVAVAPLLYGNLQAPGFEPLGLKRPLELIQILLKDFPYS